MSTFICPNCKYKTDENEQFCCKCGTKLESDSGKVFCKACGAELKTDAKFCSQCGVSQSTPKSSLCCKCGAEAEPGEQFCSKCGTKVGEPIETGLESDLETIYQKGLDLYMNCREVSAFTLLKDAAEKGHPKAQYYLGQSYRFGLGVKQDETEAAKWEKAAKEQGIDKNNMTERRDRLPLDNKNSMTEKRDSLLKKAEQGDSDAQCELGVSFFNEGFHKKRKNNADSCFEEAERWFRRAAEQGYAPAQVLLADYYFYGYGFTSNSIITSFWESIKEILGHGERNEMSAELYRVAAEKGNVAAQWKLGVCYAIGRGVRKNKEKAFNLYCMAAKERYVYSEMVGDCYRLGIGTIKDMSEAVKWYRKAKEHGYLSLSHEKELRKMGFLL